MKKGLKIAICVGVALVVAVAVFLGVFFGTRKKLSETTVTFSKTFYGSQMTNGGMTVYHDGYLYFINGTKTNDGTKLKKNVRSAICRVKIDAEGNIDKNSYEVVVDNLVGYDYGSIYFFGDFMYYTTPNKSVNYQDSVLFNQTKFMRYDLVNKKSYEIYTTKQNSSEEQITFSFYIVGSELNLVVYEKNNETITSIKIGKKPTVNFVIEDVLSCVLSENFGNPASTQETASEVNADNFIFYTKQYSDKDVIKFNKVFRTSPSVDNSTKIFDETGEIALLSIRSGKLFYSISSRKNIVSGENGIFAQKLSDKEGENLIDTNKASVISNISFTNIIFYEDNDKFEANDNVTAICFNDKSSQIIVLEKNSDVSTDIVPHVISTLSSSSDLSFIGLTTLTETEEVDSETGDGVKDETEEPSETEKTVVTHEVVYLIYTVSNKVYKVEIMRDGEISTLNAPIQLSTSSVNAPSSNLVPKVIGNYLYIFAKSVDDSDKETEFIYLHRIDLTITEPSEDRAEFIGIKDEEADVKDEDDDSK